MLSCLSFAFTEMVGDRLDFEAPRSFSGRPLVQRMENHDLLQDCACSEKLLRSCLRLEGVLNKAM